MSQSHFSVVWETYKSSICTGFSSLQHNGEFVDMTLAADGHIVKVHQVLMALSSPYIKELITSAPCPHPVIFLNNISHATLCLILEYVYTGEVLVPSKNLTSFIEAAKALHIKGLQQMEAGATEECNTNVVLVDNNLQKLKRKLSRDEKLSLPPAVQRICLKQNSDPLSPNRVTNGIHINNDDNGNYSDNHDADISEMKEDVDNCVQNKCNKVSEPDKSKLQFTLSIRGSLQIIFNRYIYNFHCTNAAHERRWRCVDYRNKGTNKCKAFIITLNNVIKKRVNMHNHQYHDKKILAKIKNNSVFSEIDDIKSKEIRKSKIDTETQKPDGANDLKVVSI